MALNKHGAEAHFVRPDRVGYTSVLQAIPGYQPVQNAQEVAWRFVGAPFYSTGPGTFAGAFGAPKMSLRDRLRMFFFKFKVRQQQRAIAKVAALPAPQPNVPAVAESTPAQANVTRDAAALAITAGIVQSGSQLVPAGVVRPEVVAGSRISYSTAVGEPFGFSSLITSQVQNPYIGQLAAESAWHKFFFQRTRGLGR